MKKKKRKINNRSRRILLFAIIFFIIALVFFIVVRNKSGKYREIPTNELSRTEEIPNVSFVDSIIYKADETEDKIINYKDKAMVIYFFNPTNKDSMEDLKKLEEMHKDYKDKINFLVINTNPDVDENLSKEYSFEIHYDFYGEARRKYNVLDVPSFIYINKDNEVFNAKTGFTTSDALEANLDILSENF